MEHLTGGPPHHPADEPSPDAAGSASASAGAAPTDGVPSLGASPLAQRLIQRVTTPGVIPLATTRGLAQRASRISTGRLPLLERVQRWMVPADDWAQAGGFGEAGRFGKPAGVPLVQARRLSETIGNALAPSADAPGGSGPGPTSPSSPTSPTSPSLSIGRAAVQRAVVAPASPTTPPLPIVRAIPVARTHEAGPTPTVSASPGAVGGSDPVVGSSASAGPTSPVTLAQTASAGAAEVAPRPGSTELTAAPIQRVSAPGPAPATPGDGGTVVRPDASALPVTSSFGPPIVQRRRGGGSPPPSAPPVAPSPDVSGPGTPGSAMAPGMDVPVARSLDAPGQPSSPPAASQSVASPPLVRPDAAIAPGSTARGALPLGSPIARVQRQVAEPGSLPDRLDPRAQTIVSPVDLTPASLPAPGPATVPARPVVQPRATPAGFAEAGAAPTRPGSGLALALPSVPVARAVAATTELARPVNPVPGPSHPMRSVSLAPAASASPSIYLARTDAGLTAPTTLAPPPPTEPVARPSDSDAGQAEEARPASAAAQPALDEDELIERVLRKLMRQLAIENERRGWVRWL